MRKGRQKACCYILGLYSRERERFPLGEEAWEESTVPRVFQNSKLVTVQLVLISSWGKTINGWVAFFKLGSEAK